VSIFFLPLANKKGVSGEDIPIEGAAWLTSTPPISQPQVRIEAAYQLHEYPGGDHSDGAYYSGLGDTESAERNEIEPCLETTMARTETSVALKTASETPTNSEYTCSTCSEGFHYDGSWWSLHYHLKDSGHTIECTASGCNQRFVSLEERKAHERRPHTSGHGRLATSTLFDCVQCNASFRSKSDLLRHAKEQQHQPYACDCGAAFSRLDVLNRHLDSFGTDDPEYPCGYCRRHRGAEGFRRKDHLMQHIRNYHHHEIDVANEGNAAASSSISTSRLKYTFPVCSHPECPQYRSEAFKQLPRSAQEQDKPFASQSAYTKHMREEHNECTFPCDVEGCTRIGRRGYFREKDLIKHRADQHPDAPDYRVSARDVRYRCPEPGCGAMLDFSSLSWHYALHAKRN